MSDLSLSWKMIRAGNARVERELTGRFNLDEVVQARLVVEDEAGREYSHLMPASNSLSRALELQSANNVSKRVNGGDFFVVNGRIVDFRPATAKRQFTHTDESIDTLINKVGMRYRSTELVEQEDGSGGRLVEHIHQLGENATQPEEHNALMAVAKKATVRERLLSKDVSLSAFRDPTDIEIEGFKEGGQFVSLVGQVWSPFKPHVEFTLGLVRVLCANGMIGTRDELVQQFQIVNEWDHHLDIASQRFREDVHRHIRGRFATMRDKRASLENVTRAYEHVSKRIKKLESSHPEYGRAKNLLGVLDTKYHLKDFYSDHVFEQSKLRGALPSHLTMFDLWNCVTEADSYLPDCQGSRSETVQGFANELMMTTQHLHGVGRMVDRAMQAPCSDPDQAFFGTVS